MDKIKFGSSFELEQEAGGDYTLKFKVPSIRNKLDDLAGGHFETGQAGSLASRPKCA